MPARRTSLTESYGYRLSSVAAESQHHRIRRSAHLIAVAVLALDVLAVHGWSLGDGRVLDDHWHARQFERGGWSWPELIDATTIEPSRFMHAWWQDKTVRWEYFRPASVALMKAVHQFTGGAPVAQHAVSIALHLANTLLVYLLCWMLTRRVLWSAAAGMIFAAYSHSIITVAWLAAQNAVLQTGLTLGAMLCYVRASGLSLYSLPRTHESAGEGTIAGGQVAGDAEHPAGLRKNWLLATVLLWAFALLSRENAVVLPVILAALDLAFGGQRHLLRRWWLHLLLFAVAGTFTLWRVLAFEPMPDVYFRRPDGPGYAGWLAVKLLHYICAAVWHSPMTIGPSGRYDPIAEVPGDCLLMLGIVGFMLLGYCAAARRTRGWWLWPLWILLAVAPATPIMATPHTGYMPAVGAAAAIALAAAAQTSHRGHRAHREQREQAEWTEGRFVRLWRSFGRLSPAAAVFFVVAVHVYAPIYRALWLSFPAAERVIVEALVASQPPPEPGTHLFFINLPFANIYLGPMLEERWPESAPIHCHVLTYAPDVLTATGPFRVGCGGEQQLEAQFLGNPGWFSGFLGRFLLKGMRSGGRPGLREQVRGDLFDMTSWYSNGQRNLRFSFHHSVNRDDYRFYVCSETGPVHRLDWSETERRPVVIGPVGPLDLVERRGQVNFSVGSHPVGAPSVSRISELLSRRDALQRIRDRAAMIIRTDLYLTGPPYPGPK